jgi:uncharacterized DUF497 family protein
MLRFVWDQVKARRNFGKHLVSFEEASTVFGDPFSLDIEDLAHSHGEPRFVIIGNSSRSRLLVVAYSEPQEGTIRIITARKPTLWERYNYEKDER